MITIGGTVLTPNAVAVQSAPVEIELVLAHGFVISGKYSLASPVVVQTGPAGTWTASVYPNDEITPTGTLYKITEKPPGFHKTYLIQVLAALGAGTHQVLDLIVPEPSAVGVVNQFVTKAYIDSIAVGGSGGPTGSTGGAGASGYLAVSNRAALDALTPVSGLVVLQTDEMLHWTWNGSKYIPVNKGVFQSGTDRDAAYTGPSIGDWYYADTNDTAEGPIYRNHANQYRKPWNMPWGEIVYLEITADVGPITTEADISGLAISPTVPGNRLLLVHAFAQFTGNTGATRPLLRITDNSNNVQGQALDHIPTATQQTVLECWDRINTGAGGTIQRKVRASTSTNNVTLNALAAAPAFIHCVDIGPSGAPA